MTLSLSFVRIFILNVMLLFSLTGQILFSQSDPANEVWAGYITSYRLNEKWGIWNDFHYIPTSFFVTRHGLTYFVNPRFEVSSGYAWVTTATSFSSELVRPEHRLWGQAEWRYQLTKRWAIRARLRYDARFRRALGTNEVLDDYIFANRYRLMGAVRYKIMRFSNGSSIHLNMLNELLFHSGSGVTSGPIDQNRTFILSGYTNGRFTIMAGYHQRVFPLSDWSFRVNNGFTFWLIQSFGWRAPVVFIPLD